GKLRLIPERARVVRRIFALAVEGYGLSLIVGELTRARVETWGEGGKGWTKNYVHKILTRRVAVGEYQPTAGGEPEGDPVADYCPAAVDESTFLQAQAALSRRKHRPGPVGKRVATLFGGLVAEAGTGDRLQVSYQGRTRRRILRS